ncbi:Fur family transcriptional regulator [Pseudomonadota bacterium]
MKPPCADHAFEKHDHHTCVQTALAKAENICRERKGRLTAQRKRVLELVWSSHKPVGAYAVLEILRADGFNGAPPTVYRALDFLLEHGLIHRIESLNAYTGCAHPGDQHSGQFLICSQCDKVAEVDDPKVDAAISNSAQQHGFSADHQIIEIRGTCPSCQAEGNQEHTENAR